MRRTCIGVFLIIFGSAAFAASTPYGGQIVIAYYDEPSSLSPLAPPGGAASIIGSAFTNGLVRQSGSGGVYPDLAEKWDVSPDGLTWTFTLRNNVKFSDGLVLTADDVAATFKNAMDPDAASQSIMLTQLLKAVRSDGKRTFQIVLNTPYGLLTELIQRPIVPARAITGDAAERKQYEAHPIGTGPFVLTEWTRDQVVLDANLSYFEGRPHLNRVIYRRFPDQKQSWTSLMQGDIDMVVDVDYEDYRVIKDDSRFKSFDYLDSFCYPLLFNLKDPLFSQLKTRQAISFAIDRQDLVDKALQGGGNPTTGPFQPGTWAYNSDPSIQPYDPARSAALLRDLGWKDTDGDWILEKNGKDFQFTLLIEENDKLKEATVKRLQWQLLQAGIRMDVEILPLADLIQGRLLQGKFQATIIQENNFGNPDVMTSTFWDSSAIGQFNLPGYGNPEVDGLIARRTVSDTEKKVAIYRQIHKLISSDVPAAFLYYRKRYTAMSARLSGYSRGIEGIFTESMKEWYVTR